MRYLRFRAVFAAALSFCFLSFPSGTPLAQQDYAKPSDIPAKAFAALPDVSAPMISPSGKKIAYFVDRNGRLALIVEQLETSRSTFVAPPGDELNFQSFFWKTEDIIIFKMGQTADSGFAGANRSENRAFSFQLEDMSFVWLGKPDRKRTYLTNEKISDPLSQFEEIVSRLPDDPDHILMALDFERDAEPAIFKVNVKSGRRQRFQNGKKGINRWHSNPSGNIVLGSGYRSRSKDFNIVYRNGDDDWRALGKSAWTKKFDLVGLAPDAGQLLVTGQSPDGDHALMKIDVVTGDIQETVFQIGKFELDGIFRHPITNEMAGVYYTDDLQRVVYFNQGLKRFQSHLAAAFPDSSAKIINMSRDYKTYLVKISSNSNPGDYYIYDRTKGQLAKFSAAREAIDTSLMASTHAVTIKMRDGSSIPAYLTLPVGKALKKLPAIVLPHGGPTARSSAEWNYEAQFYASRGYLVLQPNFRGSSGYGDAFELAGKKQWGGLMQDDITDATKWLVDQGHADPERICIAGSSYGGYAALMGVIKEPGLYKCAISVNGVTNLSDLKRNDRKYIGGRAWVETMGLAGAEDKDVSPYHRAEAVSAPVLLMSSIDDARVPWKMSQDMHKRLKKLNKPSEFVKIENGTHHMVTAQARLTSLKAAEAFLKEHIGE